MKQKDQLEVEITAATKALRMAIRLKHSIEADTEINERVPALVEQMQTAAAKGEPYKLDLGSVFS